MKIGGKIMTTVLLETGRIIDDIYVAVKNTVTGEIFITHLPLARLNREEVILNTNNFIKNYYRYMVTIAEYNKGIRPTSLC